MRELQDPGYLSAENLLPHPFEMQVADRPGSTARSSSTTWVILHVSPILIDSRHLRQTEPQVVAKLVPGQVLISDRDIDVPELRLITRLGQYRVYERRSR